MLVPPSAGWSPNNLLNLTDELKRILLIPPIVQSRYAIRVWCTYFSRIIISPGYNYTSSPLAARFEDTYFFFFFFFFLLHILKRDEQLPHELTKYYSCFRQQQT